MFLLLQFYLCNSVFLEAPMFIQQTSPSTWYIVDNEYLLNRRMASYS